MFSAAGGMPAGPPGGVLPPAGVAPTGKSVRVPFVVVVKFDKEKKDKVG